MLHRHQYETKAKRGKNKQLKNKTKPNIQTKQMQSTKQNAIQYSKNKKERRPVLAFHRKARYCVFSPRVEKRYWEHTVEHTVETRVINVWKEVRISQYLFSLLQDLAFMLHTITASHICQRNLKKTPQNHESLCNIQTIKWDGLLVVSSLSPPSLPWCICWSNCCFIYRLSLCSNENRCIRQGAVGVVRWGWCGEGGAVTESVRRNLLDGICYRGIGVRKLWGLFGWRLLDGSSGGCWGGFNEGRMV